MHNATNLVLREIEVKDLDDYLYWNHPSREFHKYNGPYYGRKNEKELENYIEELRVSLVNGEKDVLKNKKIIADEETDEIIGQVNWYWKSQETLWLEVGIVIFNENYWGKGIGYNALRLWIDKIFEERPELIRIGLSTWSGNLRMMKLAEKLGLKKEAVYRKARIVDNEYYDSLSYGILKDEWKNL
jgi:RimJ/RimL family protein N-acetyltransferase